MSKPRLLLNHILKILDKEPMSSSQLCKATNKSRKVIRQNMLIAKSETLVEQDEFGKYHLTIHGRLRLLDYSVERPVESLSFEAYSQALYPYASSSLDKPVIKCRLYIKDAQEIKEIDRITKNITRFLSTGYGLIENATNLEASAAELADEIIDLKAKHLRLGTTLDSPYSDKVTVFNIESIPPAYDQLRRFQKLCRMKFTFVMEFNGEKWAEKQNFKKVEASHEKTFELYKESLRERRSLELTKKLDWIISILTRDSPTKRTYEALHMFSTKKDLIEYVYEWFRKYHVLKDEHKLKELVRKSFSSGLFKQEKETFYCLKVDLTNRKKFYDSLISKDYKTLDNLQSNDFTYVSKRQENNGAVHVKDTKNIIEVELNKLDTFEQLFFNLFLKTRQKIDEAFILCYSSTPSKEEYKSRYRKAIELLNELLDIFYEMMNVYTNYSPIRWSKAIQNKDKLEKLFSAVFRKIANMRIRLSDAIASFRSHDFSSLAEQYISRNIYASEKLMNHIDAFKDSDVGKDSEPLLDCLWKIYEFCYENAFPEPLLYPWNFKHNEGYKKFIELQKQHPDQTYGNLVKSYSKN